MAKQQDSKISSLGETGKRKTPSKVESNAKFSKQTTQKEKQSNKQHKSSKRAHRSRSKKRGGHSQKQSQNSLYSEIQRALVLLDKAIRKEAGQLGVLRLSTMHLNFMLGHGEQIDQPSSSEFIQKQAQKLEQRIIDQLQTQIPTQWRRGTVYSFDNDQGITPPEHDAIFTGFDALGRPLWTRLLPLCLRMQVPHLESLYAQPPKALKLLMSAPIGEPLIPTITNGRLYEILAQVIIGPISRKFQPLKEEDERYTLTAQIILSKPQDRRLSVHLNILGLDPDEIFEAAAKAAPRGPLAQARNSIQKTQREVRKLQELLHLGRMTPDRLSTESENILDALGDRLLRTLSYDYGRTKHGKLRHHSMQRPTSEAWRDACKDGDERLLWDTHQETVIVIGPKSRAHVFSLSAKHITSIRLNTGELDRKKGQGRWKPLLGEQAQLFKINIQERTNFISEQME